METLDKLAIGQLVNPGPPAPATLTLAEDLSWLLEPLKENGRREEAGAGGTPGDPLDCSFRATSNRSQVGDEEVELGVELDYYRQKLASA